MLMPLDAIILCGWGICCLILSSEDGILTPLSRVPVALLAGGAITYAFWLLSEWTPGPSGYPWQRVLLDAQVLTALVWRVVVVLRELRRNSGKLFTVRPFGEPITKR